jgi:flagellar basal-body rod protein FlgB
LSLNEIENGLRSEKLINPISSAVDPLTIMQKSLDALSTQHNAIANNIANIDTPNFKRSVVTFQDQLKMAIDGTPSSTMWRTNPMHMPVQESASLDNFQATISAINDTVGRNDGNNVDMEMESAALAQNNLLYNALADVTSGYFADLRHAITEGKS